MRRQYCDCGCELEPEELPGIHTRFRCGCWVIVRDTEVVAVGVCRRHMATLAKAVTAETLLTDSGPEASSV